MRSPLPFPCVPDRPYDKILLAQVGTVSFRTPCLFMPDTAASSPTARHPASRADMALVGERVVVSGLLRRPELNSQVGEATSFDEANGCVSSQAHAHPPAASLSLWRPR